MTAAFDGREAGAVVGTPRALFQFENLAEGDRSLFFATRNDYVAASNGQRFLAAIRARDPNAPPITVVMFDDEVCSQSAARVADSGPRTAASQSS